jgi:hypothetical protein
MPTAGGDVVDVLEPVLMGKFGNLEIESGVVDVDDDVGFEFQDVLFAETDVAQHRLQVQSHFDKAHIGQIADMADRATRNRLHVVTTPIAYLSRRVLA